MLDMKLEVIWVRAVLWALVKFVASACAHQAWSWICMSLLDDMTRHAECAEVSVCRKVKDDDTIDVPTMGLK